MNEEQATILVNSLRGAQPMVLLLFFMIKRGMDIEELSDRLSLEHKAVRRAVRGLKAKGILEQQTKEHNKKVYYLRGDTFLSSPFSRLPKNGQTSSVVVNVESEESENLYSTTTTNKARLPKNGQTGNRVVSEYLDIKSPEEVKACLQALKDAGIFGRKAEKLATLHWTSPEYIRAHVASAEAGEWGNPQGMAIYNMENQVPAPELRESGHLKTCGCKECKKSDVFDQWGL